MFRSAYPRTFCTALYCLGTCARSKCQHERLSRVGSTSMKVRKKNSSSRSAFTWSQPDEMVIRSQPRRANLFSFNLSIRDELHVVEQSTLWDVVIKPNTTNRFLECASLGNAHRCMASQGPSPT